MPIGETESRVIARARAWRPRTSMVRRGSTVRVRQRALQKSRKTGFPFRIDLQVVELEAGYGALRSKKPPEDAPSCVQIPSDRDRTSARCRLTAALQQLERVRVAQQRDDGMRVRETNVTLSATRANMASSARNLLNS